MQSRVDTKLKENLQKKLGSVVDNSFMNFPPWVQAIFHFESSNKFSILLMYHKIHISCTLGVSGAKCSVILFEHFK